MNKPPNILWIVADQLRADHVGFGGAAVRTPTLDALAERGRVFDRAYVANPICMPNRCSMLTGRVPSAHGVVFNDRSLAWGANTFVRQLKDAGYHTALIGKSHIQHGMSHNVVRKWADAPTLIDPYPAGWDTLEDPARYLSEDIPVCDDFYGFEHTEFAIGHGDMVAGHHYRWALEKGANPDDMLREPHPQSPAIERYPGWWQVYQPELAEEFYSTTFVTERSIAWLAERDNEHPWMLQCSFPDPHHPFTPPGHWWNKYSADDMPEPSTIDDPLTDAPAHLRRIRSWPPRDQYVTMFGAERELVRHAMAAEFGMIEMMDAGIGRVLSALEERGMRENTVVVFTSDHGEMFGDHGLMLKSTMHYQGCLRVPLVIAHPDHSRQSSHSSPSGGRTAALASSLDLSSTILDLCGVDAFFDMQGVSLVPVLEDPDASVRERVYIEEDMPLALLGGPLPLKTRTIVDDRYRYTRYSSGEAELYDLRDDPDEMNNLAISGRADLLRLEKSEQLADALIRYSSLPRSD